MTPTEKLLKMVERYEWHDAATAPRDGSMIDVLVHTETHDYRVAKVHWYEPRQEFVEYECCIGIRFDKWIYEPDGKAGEIIRMLVEGLEKFIQCGGDNAIIADYWLTRASEVL